MTVFSKFAADHGGKVLTAASLSSALLFSYVIRARALRKANFTEKKGTKSKNENSKKSSDAGRVDAKFFKNIGQLLKILVPGVASAEFGYILLVAGMMIARTYCDLWMITNGTSIERSIIGRNLNDFLIYLMKFIAAMLPLAAVNNLMKYGLKEIAMRFRTRLTNHLYDQFLQGCTYYRICNLDNRISNPDQLLTQDVEKFCDCLSELYSNLSKPILDIVVYSYKLHQAIGPSGPVSMLMYLVLSGSLLTMLRRAVGRFTVEEQQLEGQFRHVTSRLITNSEEIAFYNGNEREHTTINIAFKKLMTMLRLSTQFRSSMGVIDSIVAKYFATVLGYIVVARPFMNLSHPRFLNSTYGELMEDYFKSGRMLVRMAEAVGRVVLAGRDITRLAGFTSRVSEISIVLRELNSGIYKRTMIDQGPEKKQLVPNSGVLIEEDHIISFQNVPIVTPNGDLLVNNLTFEIKSGMNVLVVGPNGSGKSSTFRLLGELWPMFGGIIRKPHRSKLFYIPQRPYMTIGTFRDQIIYPHSKSTATATDAELLEILKQVHLEALLDRFTWDSVEDWSDILSGGERQRVSMARVFYHKPQFAILDECTSAVSVDVEGFMYDHCKEIGTTLFTVSHRKSLWKYHEYVLRFTGYGDYSFEKIVEGKEDFGS